MIALIQRVTEARVTVDQAVISEIGPGILALLGVVKGDTEEQARSLIQRLLNYRVFEDSTGRMNHSLLQTQGALLLVPQFTLAANTHKGLRPGFDPAAPPAQAQALFEASAKIAHAEIAEKLKLGQFGADMKVSLVNDGPVTFWLESRQ